MRLLRRLIAWYAMRTGRGRNLYLRLCRPDGLSYAAFLRRHGRFHAIGEHCYISRYANITDPAYVSLGNNVRLSDCSIFGHDGSVNMINRALGTALDSVGKVEIRDNVFVGHNCIIQGGVTIGPNAIVCAGSVVNRDVPAGVIVAGVPARPVSTFDMHVEMLKERNRFYPWRSLVEERASDFDPGLEPQLRRMRVDYFYPPTAP